jgi:hypothetical protein
MIDGGLVSSESSSDDDESLRTDSSLRDDSIFDDSLDGLGMGMDSNAARADMLSSILGGG